ncbi:SpoVG family protein [Alienimonas californiensis]|uniref:Septation protein SpoVG n=1 Tax=Alienimonas californiensis TaxID=2527989 RepID=A0A517PCZ7_9PLAN|nr:SpoVG family protein [Alienimonas californiensis]QDT17258.1 Putative septation protein SpoVG [Alienimonas californiensis]
MKITDVRVKLAPGADAAGGEAGRLLAFCSITLDGCFVVRDLKLIRGEQGAFVAMPSRKITARCEACGGKNPLRANYCGDCGAARNDAEEAAAADARPKLYADIAHPINAACRSELETCVVAAWERERVLATSPDYVCRYDECDIGESFPPHTLSRAESVPRSLPNVPGVTRRIDDAAIGRTGRPPVRSPLRAARRNEPAGAFGDGL